MPTRSQRHLREIQGIDSSGRTNGGGAQGGITPPVAHDAVLSASPSPVVTTHPQTDTVLVALRTLAGASIEGAIITAVSSNPAVVVTDNSSVVSGTAPFAYHTQGTGTATVTYSHADAADLQVHFVIN